MPRRHRTMPRRWHDPPVPRAIGRAGDWRIRPLLLHRDVGPHLYGRWRRHGAARRSAASGYGVRAISPDRHLRRGRSHHGRRAGRRWLPHQLRRRAVHGTLCPVGEGSGEPRRRLSLHGARDARRAGRGRGWRSHPPASRPHRPQGAGGAAARHYRERQDFRRCRPDTRSVAGDADGSLQHGRHSL